MFKLALPFLIQHLYSRYYVFVMSLVMKSKYSRYPDNLTDFMKFLLRCRPSIKDCLNHSWLHDSYLKKLRRQSLTFTTTLLKEFLEEHQHRCAESATKHKVLLRVYQSGSSSPASSNKPTSPSTHISEEKQNI